MNLFLKYCTKLKEKPINEFDNRDNTDSHEQTKTATQLGYVVKTRHLAVGDKFLGGIISEEDVNNPDVIIECIINWILLHFRQKQVLREILVKS